jgi:hypothetical protein
MLEEKVNGHIPLHKRPEYLRRALIKSGIKEKDAEYIANLAMDHFGYNDRFLDITLKFNRADHPDEWNSFTSQKANGEREYFITLEDLGFVRQKWEETPFDGKDWRTHYWEWVDYKILEVLGKEVVEDTYGDLPKEAWIRAEA